MVVNRDSLGDGNAGPIGTAGSNGSPRGQILIVEPDPLTQWSLKTYLEKWFAVDVTGSAGSAERILETRAVDVLIVSDELPSSFLAALEERAHSFNAHVAIIRTITDARCACRPGPHLSCLEKPFELARLAGLLGVPAEEIPGQE